MIELTKKLRQLVGPRVLAARYDLLYRFRQAGLYGALVGLHDVIWGAHLRLEASSVCQLRCPACSTALGRHRDVVGSGMLAFEDFRRLIDENPSVKNIELSNWGEIFLNAELAKIVRYAGERGVTLRAANGANFNKVSDETLEALVRYGFGPLTISIDGASRETYSIYRRRGDFDQVIRNIERLNDLKKKHGSKTPKLTWQFVIFGHNEHEIDEARKMAASLDMAFRPKLNHTADYSPVSDAEGVKTKSGLGAASRDQFRKTTGRAYSRPCTQLWDSPQINWDGKLLGCCANKWGDFGNVFELGLEQAKNSERYRHAKKMVLGLAPDRPDVPCSSCHVYDRYIRGGAGKSKNKRSPKKKKGKTAKAPRRAV